MLSVVEECLYTGLYITTRLSYVELGCTAGNTVHTTLHTTDHQNGKIILTLPVCELQWNKEIYENDVAHEGFYL